MRAIPFRSVSRRDARPLRQGTGDLQSAREDGVESALGRITGSSPERIG